MEFPPATRPCLEVAESLLVRQRRTSALLKDARGLGAREFDGREDYACLLLGQVKAFKKHPNDISISATLPTGVIVWVCNALNDNKA